MQDNQTLLIQITYGELSNIIEQNVNKAVANITRLPSYITADALSTHFEVAHNKFITPNTLRKWPILRPYRRKIHGKIFFNTNGVFDAIEKETSHKTITIKTIKNDT